MVGRLQNGQEEGRLARLQHSPPLREKVYEALEELIIYGTLQPGQHLVETDLAGRLGVSRNPVREALQLLSKDGWIDLKPRQGAFVHVPRIEEVDEVFHVRGVLEVQSAWLAAKKSTPESLTLLQEQLRIGRVALEDGGEKEMINSNATFHAAVAGIAGNRTLAQILRRLDKNVRWYFAPVASRRRSSSWKEHGRLVEAIAHNDPEAAARIMGEHTEATRAAYHHHRTGPVENGD